MEIAAFIASIVSIIIAGFAIWLSITFYNMSTQVSEGIKDAAKNISSGVDKLEKLFDKLYADTFEVMRDTITDMRKHAWPEERPTEDMIKEEIEKKAEKKIKKLKADMQEQLKKNLVKQEITNDKIAILTGNMSRLLEKTIANSRKVYSEAREETLRNRLLNYLEKALSITSGIEASKVVIIMMKNYNFSISHIIGELRKLKKEGIITWEGELVPDTIIKFK